MEELRLEVEYNICEDIDGWDLSEVKFVFKEWRVIVIYIFLVVCIFYFLEEVDEMLKDDLSGSFERDLMKFVKIGYDVCK